MSKIFIKVEAYSGHRAAERPRSITIGRRTLVVTGILDRWYGPNYEYFKLSADDGCVYIIRHDNVTDLWELVMMEAGKGDEGGEGDEEP